MSVFPHFLRSREFSTIYFRSHDKRQLFPFSRLSIACLPSPKDTNITSMDKENVGVFIFTLIKCIFLLNFASLSYQVNLLHIQRYGTDKLSCHL